MTKLDWWILAWTVLLVLMIAASARAKDKTVNLEIPPSCIKAVTLVDCDMNVDPPKCRSSRIEYHPASCAIIHLD